MEQSASKHPGIRRRQFLVGAAAGAGGLLVDQILPSSAAAAPLKSHVDAGLDAYPSNIDDLAVSVVGGSSVTLSWTAPAGATFYQVRTDTRLINTATWAAAKVVGAARKPHAGGGRQRQYMTVRGLKPGDRHWFAVSTFNGREWSAPSNSAATPITSLDQVDVWLFFQNSYDAFNRRLTRVIQPDFIHRAGYEWVGTEFSDRGWPGARESLGRLLQDGAIVAAGVSANWWEPGIETLAPGVDAAEATGANEGGGSPVYHLNNTTPSAVLQLEFKSKLQLAAGFSGIEFDEYYPTDPSDTEVIAEVMNNIKAWAADTYNRSVYMSTNATYGGEDFPGLAGPGFYEIDGSEAVDYYLRNYPFELVGVTALGETIPPSDTSKAAFDGTFDLIPQLSEAIQTVAPKPFVFFVDYATPTIFWGPHNFANWPAFLRISSAQIVASGGFPAEGRSLYNALDGYEIGVFTIQSNLATFLRDNRELWHGLTWITPETLDISVPEVSASAFSQPGRVIVHLVNRNYDNTTGVMQTQQNLTATVSLLHRPTSVLLLTPDATGAARQKELTWQYSSGLVTITVPELDYHDVLVISQDQPYEPPVTPLRVVFPFPNPRTLPVGNAVQLVAVPTQGTTQVLQWSVDGVRGGDQQLGTIDSGGTYLAPSAVPSRGVVTITATSETIPAVSESVVLRITSPVALPWQGSSSGGRSTLVPTDMDNAIPQGWQIVTGRGDWNFTDSAGQAVISNVNVAEGESQANTIGYTAMIVGGDQAWTDYRYSVTATQSVEPLVWYGMPEYASDTSLGVVARFADYQNYYEYRLCADNMARLYATVAGVLKEVGSAAPLTFPEPGSAIGIAVEARGSSLELFVDGTSIRQDQGITAMSGAVGLTSSLTQNDFSAISVSALSSS
ncbi:MAG TPA: hypothetical protein VHV75_11305 [Solirubrobacteraceae bacterium]|nr:hypothetical protein [Solirubrobacteraceae bacterium]